MLLWGVSVSFRVVCACKTSVKVQSSSLWKTLHPFPRQYDAYVTAPPSLSSSLSRHTKMWTVRAKLPYEDPVDPLHLKCDGNVTPATRLWMRFNVCSERPTCQKAPLMVKATKDVLSCFTVDIVS